MRLSYIRMDCQVHVILDEFIDGDAKRGGQKKRVRDAKKPFVLLYRARNFAIKDCTVA